MPTQQDNNISDCSQALGEIAARLFDDIAAISADIQGVSRPAYSEIETATLHYLQDFAEGEGLSVTYDAAHGAVISLPEDKDALQFVAIGSHVDSVPQGGNFDGLAGVIAGLICLCRARREGERFARPVKVLAMRAEESAWFGTCYISSKAMLGMLSDAERLSTHKGDGRTLDDHMKAMGLDMEKVRKNIPLVDPTSFLEYIELHIEQGPLLVEKKCPTAIVSGIRGNVRHKRIRCIGEAGHSGAVPRAYRRDPVLATCELLHRLEEIWLSVLQRGGDLVMTVGMVATDPEKHALTRIPDSVDFSFDVRSQNAQTLRDINHLLEVEMEAVASERRVRFETEGMLLTEPAFCDPSVVEELSSSMKRVGKEPFVMASGGGHDAAMFANAGIPTGMVFVRNKNGSHNPYEAMEIPDLLAGSEIIYDYVVNVGK